MPRSITPAEFLHAAPVPIGSLLYTSSSLTVASTLHQALKAIVDQLVVETVANVKAFGPTALAACA
jgi:hypothetical protein